MTGESRPLNSRLLSAMIRERRQAEGLGLRDAAANSAVAASTLSRLERRSLTKPDLGTLERVAVWLGVPIETFFAAGDGPTPSKRLPDPYRAVRRERIATAIYASRLTTYQGPAGDFQAGPDAEDAVRQADDLITALDKRAAEDR
jgi:transcriptional regulator with XRE-family HTH domain